jgi:hypothetical protein
LVTCCKKPFQTDCHFLQIWEFTIQKELSEEKVEARRCDTGQQRRQMVIKGTEGLKGIKAGRLGRMPIDRTEGFSGDKGR